MKRNPIRRALSWLWPVTEARVEGMFGPIEARWEMGRLVANSAHGNQSFGSLHRIWQNTFDHIGLRSEPPGNVLLLGLGAGSVPWILHQELGLAPRIVAVELDPAMDRLARAQFKLDRLPDLQVVIGDATVQVHAITERFDLIVVDLFDDLDLAQGVDTAGFAQALRSRCLGDGLVCFNTVSYHPESEGRCTRIRKNLENCFSRVVELRLEGVNRVFIAR